MLWSSHSWTIACKKQCKTKNYDTDCFTTVSIYVLAPHNGDGVIHTSYST